jgi:D-alanyl-D-alanine carboxypeptidase (penicillin-binding protein 5/6)
MTRLRRAHGESSRSRAVAVVAAFFASIVVGSVFAAAEARAAGIVTHPVETRTIDVQAPMMPSELSAQAGTLIDASTGRAFWSNHARQVRLVASTTKIMTALVALSRAEPSKILTATDYAGAAVESTLGLRAGEQMTVRDLVRALLLQSANDAADTLAARLASSRAAFVKAMNTRARALGLSDTHYGNAVGLDLPRTVSSARDLATLTREALKDPLFRATVNLSHVTLKSGSKDRRINNRNPLVAKYRYVDGVKTGHTQRAGYVLVGAAHKLDANVISVVLDTPSMATRDRDTLALLRFGRAFFKPVAPLRVDRAIVELPVALQDKLADVYPSRTVEYAMRDGERYAVSVQAPKELEGPLEAGARVGTAIVKRNGRTVAKVAVKLKDPVEAPPVAAVLLHELERLLPLLAILSIMFMMGLMVQRRRERRRSEPQVRPGAGHGEQLRVDLRDAMSDGVGTRAPQ